MDVKRKHRYGECTLNAIERRNENDCVKIFE